MPRWFATIRVRTTVFATLVVTATLVAGALFLVSDQRRALVAGLGHNATNRAAEVADLASNGILPTTLTAAREDAAFTQVVNGDGEVVAASQNLRGRPAVVTNPIDSPDTVLVTRTVGSLGGGEFRIAVLRIGTPNGPMVVYAGDKLANADEAIARLGVALALGLPFLIGLVAFATWRVTGRALGPVEAIRSEVSAIGEGQLHRRVPEPPTHDEIGRLARTMNSMLARLDTAAERERRFVSDAAHELQSPLTSLRARLEVDLAARSEPDWRADGEEALDEVVEMQRLIEDLLTLARLDGVAVVPTRVLVDLDDVVMREVEHLRSRHRVAVDVRDVSAGQVLGDPDQLVRAIRNVLENAGCYAAQTITVSLHETEGSVVLRIADDGPGIPVDERARVFERFARLDDARTRDGTSTGLGLAITREIAEAHGGQVQVEDAAPGALVVFWLPAASNKR